MAEIINLDGSNPPAPQKHCIKPAMYKHPTHGELVLTGRDWHAFRPYLTRHANHKMCTDNDATGPDAYFWWGEYRRQLFGTDKLATGSLQQSNYGNSIKLIDIGPGKLIGGTVGTIVEGMEKTKDLIEAGMKLDTRSTWEKGFALATPTERHQKATRAQVSPYYRGRGGVKKKVFSDVLHTVNLKTRFFLALTTRGPDSTVMWGETKKRLLMAIEPPTDFTFGDLLPYL